TRNGATCCGSSSSARRASCPRTSTSTSTSRSSSPASSSRPPTRTRPTRRPRRRSRPPAPPQSQRPTRRRKRAPTARAATTPKMTRNRTSPAPACRSHRMAPTARAEPDAPFDAALRAALADRGVTLETRLHSGSIADVYRGRVERGRLVAVKLTAADRGPGAAALLAREHRTLASLAHPNIVRPLEFVAPSGAAVLVLEYLPAGDLVPFAQVPPARWVDAALAVVSALAAVHEAGF